MPRIRTRKRRRSEIEVVRSIMIAAAVGGVFTTAAPTGVPAFDILERAGLAALVTVATAHARRWTWFVLAAGAVVVAGSAFGVMTALAALGITAIHASMSDDADPIVGAAVGALGIQVLLRATLPLPFGGTALVTAVLIGVVAVSAYRAAGPRVRRRWRRAGVGVATFVAVAVVVFGVSAWWASGALQRGIDNARAGLEEASDGNQQAAASAWASARGSFDVAHRRLSWPGNRLIRAVPVLSQQAQVVDTAASYGAALTATATRAATAAPYESLRSDAGGFDLDRIASMRAPVAETVLVTGEAVDNLDVVASPWLLGGLRGRVDDYRDELDDAVTQARQALDALDVAPELLGAHGPRRYLVLFANPAESRGMGGFIGSWAQLDAVDGHLELSEQGELNDLNGATDWRSRTITGEPDYVARYGRLQPTRFIQNVSASPDFPTVSRVARQLYAQSGGPEVDGVIYIDPIALGALLELTGPVEVDDIPMPLTSDNVADFLMHDQYLGMRDRDDRMDRLSNVAEAAFELLTEGDLPPIDEILDTLSPMVREGRLLLSVTDPTAEAYLERIGLSGSFPAPDGNDLVSVRIANASTNKADYYLDQESTFHVHHDPVSGQTTTALAVTFTNHAPPTGEPGYILGNQDSRAGREDGRPFASDSVVVSIYSPLRPVELNVHGRPQGMQIERELGYWVTSQVVTVPAGRSLTLGLLLTGTLDTAGDYELEVLPQAAARPRTDHVVVDVVDADGNPIPGRTTRRTVTGNEPFTVRAS